MTIEVLKERKKIEDKINVLNSQLKEGKDKIEEINDKYSFCLKYHDIISKILKNLEDLAFEKIAYSINDTFNYLTFFKTSSDIYSKLGEEIKNSNSVIMSSL